MLKINISAKKDLTLNDLSLAIFTFSLAKSKGLKLLFIVEDLNLKDKEKSIEKNNIEILKKFSINSEENEIYQSQNLKIYQNIALQLLKEKKAYACFCQKDGKCECKKLNANEIKEFQAKSKKAKIKDNEGFTLLNEEGMPNQTFADAIDNMLYNIETIFTHSLDSIKIQEKLYKLLNYDKNIEYIKVKNLSERSIKELLEKGFIPDAIINYILNLNYEVSKEFFYLPDFIKEFNIENIKNNKAKFCIDELKKYNQKHLLMMDSKKLSSIVGFADSDIGELLKLYLNKAYSINELIDIFKNIFSKKECNNEIKKLSLLIKEAPFFNNYKEFLDFLSKKSGFSIEKTEEILRLLITNSKDKEPTLKEIYKYLNPYLTEVAQCR